MLGMIVAGTLRRNTKITATTRMIARPSSSAASETDERITPVLSETTVTFMPAGSVDSSCGNCFMIWLTVAITFAPGCRCTLSTIAGVPLYHAPRSTSCAAEVTHEYRRAVLVSDDRVQVVLGIADLVVAVDRVIEVGAFEIALRLAHVDV